MIAMRKEIFEIIFSLNNKLKWLRQRNPEALAQLLAKDCKTKSERLLVQDLMQRFNYVSPIEESKYIEKLVDNILSIPNFDPKTSMVVAMATDHLPDSSQYFIYKVRSVFAEKGIQRRDLFINSCNRAHKYLTNDVIQIVLLDEFIGSGKTVINRINQIEKNISSSKKNGQNIQFVVRTFAASEVGLRALAEQKIDVKSVLTVKRGISDYYDPEGAIKHINLMKKIESSLSNSFFNVTMPSLGYGQCEALYYREEGNIPNNVFPIFWWPQYSDNTERKPLFTRVMEGDK